MADGGAVTIGPNVITSSGTALADGTTSKQTHPVLGGIAEFELFLGSHAHSFTLTVSSMSLLKYYCLLIFYLCSVFNYHIFSIYIQTPAGHINNF